MPPPHVDVLLVVGAGPAPHILSARATRVLHIPTGTTSPTLIAELRVSIPRLVGVTGEPAASRAMAQQIHQAGLPTVLFTDSVVAPIDGVELCPIADSGPPMDVVDSLIELVGGTPMVRLDRVGRDLPCHLLAKLEYFNPGGSVKDRPALEMLNAAEAEGLLRRGSTIVEPTSGNTGVALAMVAAQRGYHCIFTMPDKIAEEKRQLLRAYGAKVVVCPTAVAPEHPDSYYSVANQITASTPGAFQPNQYHNPDNPRAHERSTGPEIWRQTAGRITHFVAGVGTGGTISGVGRYLKSAEPGHRGDRRRSRGFHLFGRRRSAVSGRGHR